MTLHNLYLIFFKLKMIKKNNKVVKFMNEMEQMREAKHKFLKLQQIKEIIEKEKKRDQYVRKGLKLCISWCGPVVSVDDLHSIFKSHPDQNEVIISYEKRVTQI